MKAQEGDRYGRWLEAPVEHPPRGGEGMMAFAARVRGALERLSARHPAGRVLVVCHGGAIASALCGWLDQPLNAIWTFRLDNTSITRVLLPAGQVLAVNETGHLAAVPAEALAP